jgi:hypothetical protein
MKVDVSIYEQEIRAVGLQEVLSQQVTRPRNNGAPTDASDLHLNPILARLLHEVGQ